jgi:hypothetical protein
MTWAWIPKSELEARRQGKTSETTTTEAATDLSAETEPKPHTETESDKESVAKTDTVENK